MAKREQSAAEPPVREVKRVAVSTWQTQLASEIAAARSAAEVRAISAELKTLSRMADARLIHFQMADSCGVVLVKSTEREDQDPGWNFAERHVSAEFTAGPRGKAHFKLTFDVEDNDSDKRIAVDGIMQYSRDDTSSKKERHGKYKDMEIREFLKKAELLDAVPDPEYAGTEYSETERLRWVYGDVVREAIELVEGKHGVVNGWDLGLGVGSETIYGHLGLKH